MSTVDSGKDGCCDSHSAMASQKTSPSPHSNDKGFEISKDGQMDPETLRRSSTNSAPWSVFTLSQKRFIVAMVSIASFFSPLSANIYFPALNTLAASFGTSKTVMNLTLTSYMIFQGLAPTIFGDLADMAGRRPAYIIGFTIYLGACVGIANCNSFAALLVLRCLQSSGSSSSIALGSGVVADISTSAERGVWMGWAQSSTMFAPAIAPVLGGIFAELLGWRWIFWFLVILAGTFMVPFFLLVPETGRNVVGNGSLPPPTLNMSLLDYIQRRRQRLKSSRDSPPSQPPTLEKRPERRLRVPNPFNALKVVFEKDVGLLLFFNSMVYCASYDIMTSAPDLLADTYGFDALQIGLCFLPIGIGSFLAPMVSGQIMDWNFRRTARKIGYEIVRGKANDLRNFPLERCRGQLVLPSVLIGAVGILCYGWAMEARTNLAAPLVFMFIVGFFLTCAFSAIGVMLVDMYPMSPSTATSANNLVRCWMGAGASAIILEMIRAMGRGWCFTFHALILAALTSILWVLERHGPRWREERRLRMEVKSMPASPASEQSLQKVREQSAGDASQRAEIEGGEKTTRSST